jgi:hypothetical protein
MLRAGTAQNSLTFMVLREEPEKDWMRDTRAPVYLDVDRLNVTEIPIGNIDIFLGFPATSFRPLADHPLRDLMALIGNRGLLLLDAQFPSPPPRGGEPSRLWARTRIGLRTDEISDLADLLGAVHYLAPDGEEDRLGLLSCSRQRLVIGRRRSRPNATGEIFGPGGYCRRFHSARSTRVTTLSTTAGSKPSASSSDRPWAPST